MKRIKETQMKTRGGHLVDTAGLEKLPALAAFLTDAMYEATPSQKAEPREPGGIWIQPRGGVLNVLLKEPSQGMLCRLEAPSIKELWAMIEAALRSEADVWEADPNAKAKKLRRRG